MNDNPDVDDKEDDPKAKKNKEIQSSNSNDSPGVTDSNLVRVGPVFYSALVMGLIMIGLGTAFEVMHLGSFALKTFMFCAGFGIILGALGSTANLNVLGTSMTVAGSAALAIGIFLIILEHTDNRYLRINIEDDTKEANMILTGDDPFFGSRQDTSYDFIAFNKDISRNKLSLFVTINGTDQVFKCIDASLIRPHLGSGGIIHWNYNFPEASLSDEMGNTIAKVGPCRSGTLTNKAAADAPIISNNPSWTLFSTANATEPELSVDELIGKLNSDNPYVRHDARTELGKKGIVAARPLLSEVKKPDNTYRKKLGALVSLDEIAESKAGQDGELKAIVDEEDLKALTKASTSSDDTIQSFATNVLVNLKDPRAIPAVIQQLPESSANGQYNLLWVLHQTLPLADEEQKQSVAETTKSFVAKDERSLKLIESIQLEAH